MQRSGVVLTDRSTLPPAPLTSFVGRRREIEAVGQLMAEVRLLTLTGPGGVGKTRLALEVASGLADRFPDGVCLVELAPLADPALVPRTLVAALDLPESADRPPLETAIAHLRPRAILLVLDNCEHLIDACAELAARLLQRCPAVRLLATSREALEVPGETSWPVPPLIAPGSWLPPEELTEYEAVQLFVERARAVQPAFALDECNAAAVAEVCHRLDGLPLAIELAAARVRALGVAEIAERLANSLALLARPRAAEERHRTLRGVIDWSFDLLSAPEQAFFRRLAVFAGGWTLEAAEAVCGFDGAEAVALLARLVDRSLVEASSRDGTTRYRLLEVLRQYGWELLEREGEAAELRGDHAAFFRQLVERAEDGLTGAAQGIWLDRLEQEHDNVRAALRWSVERGQVDLGVAIASVLWRFWWVRGHLAEGRQRLGDLVALAAVAGDPTPTLARALVTAGQLAVWQGDYSAARDLLEAGLERARALGEERAAAYALTFLARAARDRGEHDQAGRHGGEAVALFRRLDDGWGLALALHFAGLATEPADLEAAQALFAESASIFRERGCRWDRAMPLRGLGIVAYRRGDYPTAEARFAESTGLFRARGDVWSLGMLLNDAGQVALARGDPARAEVLFRESLHAWRQAGNRRGAILALTGFACVAAAHGRGREALRLFGAAEAAGRAGGAVLEPTAREARAGWIARARRRRGAAEVSSLWAEGEALALDDALARASAPAPGRAGPLTDRERAVAALVAEGCSNRQIGQRLVISERTAERHVENIRGKLGFHSRAQVAAWHQGQARSAAGDEMGTSPDVGSGSGR